jgi:hypothetical protein
MTRYIAEAAPPQRGPRSKPPRIAKKLSSVSGAGLTGMGMEIYAPAHKSAAKRQAKAARAGYDELRRFFFAICPYTLMRHLLSSCQICILAPRLDSR